MSTSPQHFEELELIAEKAGELNDRVEKIETELGSQTKTLESAALVLDAAIKGLGALKSNVLENDLAAVQLSLNDKTAHLAREVSRFEAAVAEIDRRAESGDNEIKAALLTTAQSLRAQFDAKSAEVSEWGNRVEAELKAHATALAAIPPVIKGADAVGFNPSGEWSASIRYMRMDVVSYLGSSYVSNIDNNTDRPGKSANWTTISKRAGAIGMGGVGDIQGLSGVALPAQITSGVSTWAIGDVFYANTTKTMANLPAVTSGYVLSTQGAGLPPIWAESDVSGALLKTGGTMTGNITFNDTGEGLSFHGGGTLTGAIGVLRASGNLLLGGLTTDGTGVLQFPAATAAAGGITFGTDINLFRSVAGGQLTAAAGGMSFKLTSSTGTNGAAFLMSNTGGTYFLGAESASGTAYISSGGTAYSLAIVSPATRSIQLAPAGTTALTLDASQNATFTGAVTTSSSTRSGPGAVAITASLCKVTSTGVADALTLADGVDGQRLTIVHDVDGGSFVLTPTTKTGWSTFTSTVVGETVSLVFVTTRGWMVTGSYLGVIAP